jgi:tRNA(adenine34) deaminase
MSGWSSADQECMRRALAEAEIAGEVGEVPVGAVLVRNNEIIGSGVNRCIVESDPTAHAEIVAMRMAAQHENNYRLKGTTMYVTLEPCVMCVGAMLHARVGRLVFGAYDSKTGAAGSVFDLAHRRELNHRIEVNGGLMEEQCSEMLRLFFASRRR